MYQYLLNISSVLRSSVDCQDFADSLSDTQYKSKQWLVDTLFKYQEIKNPSILILGGWYGSYLVPMLVKQIEPSIIHFNDLNVNCLNIAKKLHRKTNIDFHQFDATSVSFDHPVDIVINTSCEHMSMYNSMLNNKNKDCLFVLQSCDNKDDPGHINVSSSTEDFAAKIALSRIKFKGRLALGHKNRYMVIGQR